MADNSAFNAKYGSSSGFMSSSATIALMGHSGSHNEQSIHSSGSITRKLGPSWKQSTGQTSTQSVYLHLIQFSVTTKVMSSSRCWLNVANFTKAVSFAVAVLLPLVICLTSNGATLKPNNSAVRHAAAFKYQKDLE